MTFLYRLCRQNLFIFHMIIYEFIVHAHMYIYKNFALLEIQNIIFTWIKDKTFITVKS